MSSPDACPYLANWALLLPGDAPCGEDCSFDEAFEALQAEATLETSLHADRPTNWVAVLEMADALLSRSKDLWALCYGVAALLHTRGLADTGAGLTVLADLLETSWDSLHPLPKRMQRRLAPLVWLSEHLRRYTEAGHFSGETRERLLTLQTALERLQQVLETRCGDEAPAFRSSLPPIPAAPVPETLQAPLPAPLAQPTPPPPDPVRALDAAPQGDGRIPQAALNQVLRLATDNMRQLGDHLLSLHVDDERAYLLHRAACWGSLLHMPFAGPDRRCQIECSVPDDTARTYAQGVEEGRFAEILPALERSAAKAPFWFDGHHLVARCLEGIGAPAALACVRHALAQLVRRFPELPTLHFKNGKPFASSQTLAWVESLLQSPLLGLPPSPGHGALLAPGGNADEELRLQEAIEMFPEKGFRAGLRHLGNVPPGKTRASVRHGLSLARYCAATGNKPAAARILQALYSQLEAWHMLDWEPELSTDILSLLLSFQIRKDGTVTNEMINTLHWYNLDAAFVVFTEGNSQ